jgi:hypothetical protein
MNGEKTEIEKNVDTVEPVQEVVEAVPTNLKHEREPEADEYDIDKRIKIEATTASIVDMEANSPSPYPHALISESRSEVDAQIADLSIPNIPDLHKNENEQKPKILNEPEQQPEPKIETNNAASRSPSKQNTPIPAPKFIKADLLKESGRNVEDIIDGSDLRRFLNKSLTKYIVKGLDDVVCMWERGDFDTELKATEGTRFDHESRVILQKTVVSKFAEILSKIVENQ